MRESLGGFGPWIFTLPRSRQHNEALGSKLILGIDWLAFKEYLSKTYNSPKTV
jgi:hypothetical protein